VKTNMKGVVVYCGSSDESRPVYLEAASSMGRALVRRDLTLIFGGGRTGMMGALADAALQAGGKVIGIMPRQFNTPVLAHPRLSEMILVDSMHQRKAMMAEMGDAFIALPGGFGTLEELFEILTWAQIGMHAKPVGVLNAEGYFDPLLALIEHVRREGFIYSVHRALLACERTPDALLDRLAAYEPPPGLERWVDRNGALPGIP
jgi:uncharacterized protein (TIGR00730 family)